MRALGLILILFCYSCNPQITKEQKDKFENCRSHLGGLKAALLKMEMDLDYGKESFADLLKMDADDFVLKYHLYGKELDLFLEKVCEAYEREGDLPIELNDDNLIQQDYDITKDTILNKSTDH